MGANDPEYPLHRVLSEFLEDHQRLVDNYPQLTLRILSTSPLVVTQDGKFTVELLELQEKVTTLIKNGQAGPELASGGSLDTLPCAVILDNYIPKVVWTKDGVLSADIECSFPRVVRYDELGTNEVVPGFQAGFPLFQTEPYDLLLQNIEQIMILDVSTLPDAARVPKRYRGSNHAQSERNPAGQADNLGDEGNLHASGGLSSNDHISKHRQGVKWPNTDPSSDDEREEKTNHQTRGTPGIGVAGLNGRDNMRRVKQTRDQYKTAQSQESITDLLFNSGQDTFKDQKSGNSPNRDKLHVNGSQAHVDPNLKSDHPLSPGFGPRKKSEVKHSISKEDSNPLRKRISSEKTNKDETGEAPGASLRFSNLEEGALSAGLKSPLKRLKTSQTGHPHQNEHQDGSVLTYQELLVSLNPEAPLLTWGELNFSAAIVKQLKERLSDTTNPSTEHPPSGPTKKA